MRRIILSLVLISAGALLSSCGTLGGCSGGCGTTAYVAPVSTCCTAPAPVVSTCCSTGGYGYNNSWY